MPRHSPTYWFIALAVLPAACSDPQAPTESNFRKAIEAELAAEPVCRSLTLAGSPPHLLYWGAVTEETLLLQKAGLIDIRDATESPYPDGHEETVHDMGRWTEGKGFCLGTRKLEKIVTWTDPSQARNGEIWSNVTYEWTLIPASWATEDVLKGFRELRRGTEQVNLFKTPNGWSPHP